MKAIVLLNAAAGTTPAEKADEDERAIRWAFDRAGMEVDVRHVKGPELVGTARELAQSASGNTVIVAAGGDGTQSAVASALAGTPALMGVLPMGTLNHFAKDLGLPQDVDGAARAIATGRPRPIDVAEVNDRVFVNNSSIGLYPHVVRRRDEMRERLGHGKWYAMFLAIVKIFRRFPLVRLRMTANGRSFEQTTPFVFVGNNQYQIDRLNLGTRTSLENGDLCVYFANRTGRWGIVALAFRALIGRLRQARDFNALCATELWLDTPSPRVSVALDGEVVHMTPPLHYRVRPRSLNVVLPPPPSRPPST
jgi:diacylglycerol kinase family enzyme